MLCPELPHPSGGVRKLYRLVDVLRANGIPAVIGHQQPGFRYTWFESATPIAYGPDMWPSDSDLLVVPEVNCWEITPQTRGIRKIIFNQNAYQTFLTRNGSDCPPPYLNPDYLATLVVSEDSRAYLQYAFPGHPVFRIHNSIDPALFYFPAAKSRRIAYMSGKNPADAAQVLGIMAARRSLRGFEIVPIEDKTETQTAAILRDAAVFLSFCVQEGWALPPMEAMACGCVTIGYDGCGGREYFTDEHAFPVRRDDIIGFVATVERTLEALEHAPHPLIQKSRRASQFIHAQYSPSREEDDILHAWEQIMAGPASIERRAVHESPRPV